jgi:transcriptional regulator with XRE-family HTH domain
MNPNEWRFPQFTKRFRELRGKRDNTEFAKFLGISRQTVGFYYNGDRIPDAMMLKQIAEKCGVSTDYLLGLTDTQSTNADARAAVEYTKLPERAVNLIHSDSIFGRTFRELIGLLTELDNSAFLAAELLAFVDKANTAIFEFKRLVNGDALIGENGPDELDEAVSRKRYDTERAFTYMLDELLKRENYHELLDAANRELSDDSGEYNDASVRNAILANLERVRSGEEARGNG